MITKNQKNARKVITCISKSVVPQGRRWNSNSNQDTRSIGVTSVANSSTGKPPQTCQKQQQQQQCDGIGPFCKQLQAKLPELKIQFERYSNKNNGVFPLMSQKYIDNALEAFPASQTNDTKQKRAAVLVPLYSDNGTPSILFTARSPYVPTHPSQISFPGGHFQAGKDASLIDTALRETQEELRGDYPFHDTNAMVILGTVSTIPAINGIPVTPVLAVLTQKIITEKPLRKIFPGCSDEVEQVFGVSISRLFEHESTRVTHESRFYGRDFPDPCYPSPYGTIWGLTAIILQPLLRKLYKPVFLPD